MKNALRLLSLLLALLLLTACGAATPAATETTFAPVSTTATTSAEPQPTTIKNIIVIIGDGMGDAQIDVGELGMGKTYVFRDWQRTHSNTNSLDASGRATKVTDSAAGGTTLATVLDENILKVIVVIALPCVAIFLAFSKGLGKDGSQMKEYPPVKVAVISLIIGLLIGFYDGLIGPGTGTFLILLFCGILGMDMLKAGGCAKIANLASNVASVLVVLRGGQIVFAVAIPAMLAAMLGNWMGSRIAIKGGAKRIRSVIYVVLALLFVRIIGDLLGFSVSDLGKLVG
jgi:hypothetical protein